MFNKEEYTAMKWRIDEVPPAVSVFFRFPDLKAVFLEFAGKLGTEQIDENIIIRFIIFCYHKNSPLIRRISDVGQRKVEAWKQAGINPADYTDAGDISSHKNDNVTFAIMQFLKFERDTIYLALTVRHELMYKLKVDMLKGDSKATTYKSYQEIEKDIDKLSHQAFAGDTDLMNNFAVSQVLEQRKLSPEENAD